MATRLSMVSDSIKHLKLQVEEQLIVQALVYAGYRDNPEQREKAGCEMVYLTGRYNALHDVIIELSRAEDQPKYVSIPDSMMTGTEVTGTE